MNVILYKTTDDQDTINRSKTALATLNDVKIKGVANTATPTLFLSTANVDLDDVNYMWVSEYNRYYFVTSKNTMPGGVEVVGSVDVLALPGVSSVTGIVNKSATYSNEYINDGDYVCESREYDLIYNFPSGFGSQTAYLVAMGGKAGE